MKTNEILAKLAELETQMKAIEEDGTNEHIAAIALRRQLAIERNAHADHVADFCKRIADLEARLAKAEATIDLIIGFTDEFDPGDRVHVAYLVLPAQKYRKEFPREIQAND